MNSELEMDVRVTRLGVFKIFYITQVRIKGNIISNIF
jgi:hypothetical protein